MGLAEGRKGQITLLICKCLQNGGNHKLELLWLFSVDVLSFLVHLHELAQLLRCRLAVCLFIVLELQHPFLHFGDLDLVCRIQLPAVCCELCRGSVGRWDTPNYRCVISILLRKKERLNVQWQWAFSRLCIATSRSSRLLVVYIPDSRTFPVANLPFWMFPKLS